MLFGATVGIREAVKLSEVDGVEVVLVFAAGPLEKLIQDAQRSSRREVVVHGDPHDDVAVGAASPLGTLRAIASR
jgi:hypothetical protein